MIPLHRPPFGIKTVLASALTGGERASLQRLEEAYSQFAGMPAVWLPSARAGIAWALQANTSSHQRILAPAFTCKAVHDALGTTGGNVEFIDAAESSFLLSQESIIARQKEKHSVLLCEVYGHTYDLASLSQGSRIQPVVRIVDMAMAVPHPSLFQRLESQDFAVISFGAGKSMYACWGGMGFSRDQNLVAEVRKLRDQALTGSTSGLSARRLLESLARVVGNYPVVHSAARKLRERLKRDSKNHTAQSNPTAAAINPATTREWILPSTRMDRGLALWNLQHAQESYEARVDLAKRYERNLADAEGIVSPKISQDALSHFTVRVDARLRNTIKGKLYAQGINTITLWTLSPQLTQAQFPNAFRASSEVLNLPLSPWMSADQLDHLCEVLRREVKASNQALRENRQAF